MRRPFYLMAKPASDHCNLACRYCFYRDKGLGAGRAMSDEVLEAYVRNYIACAPQNEITFIWQGGEPTLCGLGFFERAVELQRRYAGSKVIYNALQTNGTLIDETWCRFFKEHGFLIGLSLDGPRSLHDAARCNLAGGGSFDKVINALHLLRRFKVEFNILTVVGTHNVHHGSEIYRFLKSEGATQMQFIPLTGIETSLDPQLYGRFLTDVFDAWYPLDAGRIFVQHIEQWFMAYAGIYPSLCIFRPACGDQLILEQNGDIYSCDHFVDKEHLLGNILRTPLSDIVYSPRQTDFGQEKYHLPAACQKCHYLIYCRGGCPKHRPQGQDGHGPSQFCTSYQQALAKMLPCFAEIYKKFVLR